LGGFSHGPQKLGIVVWFRWRCHWRKKEGEGQNFLTLLDPKQRLLAPYIQVDPTDIAKDTDEMIQDRREMN